MLSSQPSPFNLRELKEIKIDFESQPIDSFRVLEALSQSPWNQLIDNEERQTKKDIVKVIEY